MKKYRCPNCKEVFIGTQEVCPKCGVKLHYANKEKENKPVEEAVSVSNFIFSDPDVIKHEEKFVPVTSIESMDDKDKDSQDAVAAPLGVQPMMQMSFAKGESFFDGKPMSRFGVWLSCVLIFIITLGFGLPWAYCRFVRWNASHTVVQGHRLKFIGKGGRLFGKFLLWIILIPLTLGIITIWVHTFLERWKVKYMEYVD